MADLISLHLYGHPNLLPAASKMIPRPNSHRRSVSSDNRSPSPAKTVIKMKSTTAIAEIANSAARQSPSNFADVPENDFSTLRDPRMVSTSDLSETSSSSHHPDLSSEVAALSIKLIQAVNTQTTLDDTLTATRQELEEAHDRVRSLQIENAQFHAEVADGMLVKRNDVDGQMSNLQAQLAEERSRRARVEKDKKCIEQELETLTAALFEEANRMVAAAKHERDAMEKKNEQLRTQIKDTEMLLASHQEQLAELKAVIQELNSSREEADAHTNGTSTAPSSPAVTTHSRGGGWDLNRQRHHHSSNSHSSSIISLGCGDISPGPSTGFSQFIKIVSRTDVQAYEDFRDLFTQSLKGSKPSSRATSASYAGLNVMGLANISGSNHSMNGSTQSASGAATLTSPPSGSPSHASTHHMSLKDTRFYKRSLTEDIEPALRLDLAPGISWLMRRAVLSGICEGGLVVEPLPTMARKYSFPCAMCGERRKGSENRRTHRFRTSESETAQRYALCTLCLEKIRACCELTGYLRLILDGHIRITDVEDEKDAWDETIRLRERIFWARIGAGVIPVWVPGDVSRKPSPGVDAVPSQSRQNPPVPEASVQSIQQRDHADWTGTDSSGNQPFVSGGRVKLAPII